MTTLAGTCFGIGLLTAMTMLLVMREQHDSMLSGEKRRMHGFISGMAIMATLQGIASIVGLITVLKGALEP